MSNGKGSLKIYASNRICLFLHYFSLPLSLPLHYAPCFMNLMKLLLPYASRSNKIREFPIPLCEHVIIQAPLRYNYHTKVTKVVVVNYHRSRWSKTSHTSSKIFRYRGFSVCVLCTTFFFCSDDKAFPRTFRVALKIK